MLRVLAALLLLLAARPAAAIERKRTVYLDRMAGFERHMRSAIDEARLRLTLLDESVRPDFRMFLDPKFKNAHAEVMYRKATGRSDNAVLELYDVRGKRGVVRHEFKLTADEMEQRKAAQQFVEKIRDQMNRQDQPPDRAFPEGPESERPAQR